MVLLQFIIKMFAFGERVFDDGNGGIQLNG